MDVLCFIRKMIGLAYETNFLSSNLIRLLKELAYYKDEVKTNEMKVDEMKRDTSKDMYDVKRYEEILNESYMMVPDTTKRLQTAINDLLSYTTNNKTVLDPTGTWYQTAQTILLDNQTMVSEYEYIPNNFDTTDPVTSVVETCVDNLADGEAF
jgi:tubulin-specific chaperone A